MIAFWLNFVYFWLNFESQKQKKSLKNLVDSTLLLETLEPLPLIEFDYLGKPKLMQVAWEKCWLTFPIKDELNFKHTLVYYKQIFRSSLLTCWRENIVSSPRWQDKSFHFRFKAVFVCAKMDIFPGFLDSFIDDRRPCAALFSYDKCPDFAKKFENWLTAPPISKRKELQRSAFKVIKE